MRTTETAGADGDLGPKPTGVKVLPVPDPRDAGARLRRNDAVAYAVLDAMPVGVLIETGAGASWINGELRRILRQGDTGQLENGEFERSVEPPLSRASGSGWPVPTMARAPESPWTVHQLRRRDRTTCACLITRRRVQIGSSGPVDATFVVEDARAESDAYVRGAFLAMIGHELRTPITSIVGGAELLRGGTLDAPTRDEVTDLLVEEANRVHHLVAQLAALSSLQPAQAAGPEPVHLVHVARAVGGREAARRRGVRVRLPAVDPTIPAALGDEAAIAQTLEVLIDNAAKHGGSAGDLEIAVERVSDEVVVHVLDRGPGLSDGDHEQLFELFERAGASDAGSGIGLYVARQLMLGMGGRIWATTRDGGGADFALALPVAR